MVKNEENEQITPPSKQTTAIMGLQEVIVYLQQLQEKEQTLQAEIDHLKRENDELRQRLEDIKDTEEDNKVLLKMIEKARKMAFTEEPKTVKVMNGEVMIGG